MRVFSVKLRGEDHDVEIIHDGGYEPDTNAHEIEWVMVDASIELTPEEYDAVERQVYEVLSEGDTY